MDRRTHRRKKRNSFLQILNVVKAFFLAVAAIAVVIFVVVYIKNQFVPKEGSEPETNFFSSLFSRTASEEFPEETGFSEEEQSLPDGLHETADGKILFIQNGEALKNSWLDSAGGAYAFDENGAARTGEYRENAFLYRFSDKGILTEIHSDPSYREPDSEYSESYPGLVRTELLWAYLDKNDSFGRFFRILYKKATGASHQLGSAENPQYTRPGSLQLEDGYIYWLPVLQEPDETEALLNGKLYRMSPDEGERQIIAENAEGFKVLPGADGKTAIYYYAGGSLHKCGTEACRKDDTVTVYTEDMDYEPVIQNGKLYLRLKNGQPVRKETSSFCVNGFDYALSATGEILRAADSSSVRVDGREYRIEKDEAFGTRRNRVIRTGADGTEELISGEFFGETANLYYNRNDGKMYAECVYVDQQPYIIQITTDGDVDILIGGDGSAQRMKIEGFGQDTVFIREIYAGGTVKFEEISTSYSTPLAAGVEPVSLHEIGEMITEDIGISAPSAGGGSAPDDSAGPGSELSPQPQPGGPVMNPQPQPGTPGTGMQKQPGTPDTTPEGTDNRPESVSDRPGMNTQEPVSSQDIGMAP